MSGLWPVEKLAPAEMDPLSALAGTLLHGRALIVGGGRFTSLRAALVGGNCSEIVVLEPDPRMKLEDEIYNPHGTKVMLFRVGIEEFHGWGNGFSSIHFDPYPYADSIRAAAKEPIELLDLYGRLIMLEGALDPWAYFPKWRPELLLDVPRCGQVRVYRKG